MTGGLASLQVRPGPQSPAATLPCAHPSQHVRTCHRQRRPVPAADLATRRPEVFQSSGHQAHQQHPGLAALGTVVVVPTAAGISLQVLLVTSCDGMRRARQCQALVAHQGSKARARTRARMIVPIAEVVAVVLVSAGGARPRRNLGAHPNMAISMTWPIASLGPLRASRRSQAHREGGRASPMVSVRRPPRSCRGRRTPRTPMVTGSKPLIASMPPPSAPTKTSKRGLMMQALRSTNLKGGKIEGTASSEGQQKTSCVFLRAA